MPDGVTAFTADRKDPDAFAGAVDAARRAARVERSDLVIDCIGFDPQDARQDLAVFRDRAAQLVFLSSDFVFVPAHRRFPQGEDSDHYLADGDAAARSSYGGRKRLCKLERVHGDTGVMAWSILRPCRIYGPGVPARLPSRARP